VFSGATNALAGTIAGIVAWVAHHRLAARKSKPLRTMLLILFGSLVLGGFLSAVLNALGIQ